MAECGGRERLGRTSFANGERVAFGVQRLNLKIEDCWHWLTSQLEHAQDTLKREL